MGKRRRRRRSPHHHHLGVGRFGAPLFCVGRKCIVSLTILIVKCTITEVLGALAQGRVLFVTEPVHDPRPLLSKPPGLPNQQVTIWMDTNHGTGPSEHPPPNRHRTVHRSHAGTPLPTALRPLAASTASMWCARARGNAAMTVSWYRHTASVMVGADTTASSSALVGPLLMEANTATSNAQYSRGVRCSSPPLAARSNACP